MEDKVKKKDKKINESRLGTAPVKTLMISMGLPIVLSMMLQAVYNIVDSAFLSKMAEGGEQALTALGLAFPIQLLMVAVAIGTGVGANALLSKSLGQGNREKASRVAGNTIFLGIIICIIFIIFGIAVVPAYVNSQSAGGAISETVLSMTVDYLRICCCVSFGIIFFSVFEKMLQATGRSTYSTIAQIVGAVVNIIFDPIMIYGLFGCPEFGVKGAAYATVLGQIVSAILTFTFHMKLNVEIDKKLKYLKPSGRIIKEIYAIGLPAIISQALLSVMTCGLNMVLGQINEVGENAVTVYGLYCKIQQLIIFASVGMRDAITPIVSFAHGMKSKKRIKEGIRFGLIYTTFLMVLGLVITEGFAGSIAAMFSLSDVTYDLCVSCIRIVSIGFIFAGINIALQGIFQAIECGIESLVISAGRQVVFIVPIAWILAKFVTGAENASIIWWTFLIGETITLILGVLMYKRAADKKINVLN